VTRKRPDYFDDRLYETDVEELMSHALSVDSAETSRFVSHFARIFATDSVVTAAKLRA
jgi:hypothetical protein